MKVGPRNEKMIAQVKNILEGTFGCAGFGDEESSALCKPIALEKLAEKCESKDELLDAIYYACGECKEGLEDERPISKSRCVEMSLAILPRLFLEKSFSGTNE